MKDITSTFARAKEILALVKPFSPAAFIGYDWIVRGGVYDQATQSWVPFPASPTTPDDTVDAWVVYGLVLPQNVVTPPGYTVFVNPDLLYAFDDNVHDLDTWKAQPGYNNNIKPGENLVPCLDDGTTLQLTWSSQPFNKPQEKKP